MSAARAGQRIVFEVPMPKGMNDALDGESDDWQLIQNMYPVPGGLEMRPRAAYSAIAPHMTGTTAPTAIWQHTMADGTEYTFVIADSKLFRVTWTGTSVTFTDVTPAALNIGATAFMCSLGDRLIVTDNGSNVPWYGTNLGATPITKSNIALDAAGTGTAWGPPVVKDAKVFFVKGSSHNTIVWSEEADCTLGYEQTGYNNTWQLTQTASEDINCLIATNEELIVGRDTSIGSIYGQVNSEFKSTATQPAISPQIGITGHRAAALVNGEVWFADAMGRPHVYTPGGGPPTPVWQPASETLAGITASSSSACVVASHPELGFVLFARTGASGKKILVYDAESRRLVAIWILTGLPAGTAFDISAPAIVKDGTGTPRLAFGVYDAAFTRPEMWLFGRVDDAIDAEASNVILVGPAIRNTKYDEVRWDRIDWFMRGTPRVQLDYTTSRATYGTPLSPTVSTAVATNGGTKATIGINGFGRWIRPRFQTGTSGATDTIRCAVTGLRVEGVLSTSAPGIR